MKLVSLNIERSKHLERCMPFLKQQNADIICLQELCERDIPLFESELGMHATYGPVGRHPADPPEEGSVMTGICILSREPIESSLQYYAGSEDAARSQKVERTIHNAPLLCANVAHEGTTYRILTTHFTWSFGGLPTEDQRIDMRALLGILSQEKEFSICGDFNAPRGGEIFAMLNGKYRDNIPEQYKTSIDVKLHRAGHLPAEKMDQKMVDGLFTTPAYSASAVELHSGVSDHLAITATISL